METATFIFLLTVWTAESPRPEVYVVADNLTGAECVAAMVDYNNGDPSWQLGYPSCEFDVSR